jgi:hypothetical protein
MSTCGYWKHSKWGLKQWALVTTEKGLKQWALVTTESRQEIV